MFRFVSEVGLRADHNHPFERMSSMTQRQLERELANATGESVDTIRQRGFSLVEVPDPEPLVIDWDEVYPVDRARFTPRRAKRGRLAA